MTFQVISALNDTEGVISESRNEITGSRFQSAALLVITLCLCLIPLGLAHAQTEPPPPMLPMPAVDRLAPPPTEYPPTQASLGAQVFYQVCMACHGDRGQGLTDEWRGALDLPDQNCWQSRCHASNYPPGGFVFPKIVPAVVSPGMVARFETALDLYTFLKTEMPFQAPGSLKEEEYWQLTAFLLRANAIDPGDQALDASRAARIPMRAALSAAQAKQAHPLAERGGIAVALAGIVAAILAAILAALSIYALYRIRK